MKNIILFGIFGILLLMGGFYALPAAAKPSALEEHCVTMDKPQDPILADYLFCQCSKKAADAWCDGYFQGVMNLIHNGDIAQLMDKNQCFDLNEYIPDWYGPVKNGFIKKMSACKNIGCLQQQPILAIIESLVENYPCRKDSLEYPIRGVKSPRE